MENKPKILIVGSNGLVGKIIVDELNKQGYPLVLIDKTDQTNPIDLTKDSIKKFLLDVEILISLASNTDPRMSKEKAAINIEIIKNLLEDCGHSPNLKKIINASSVMVYPYYDFYLKNKKIDKNTKPFPNLFFYLGNIQNQKFIQRNYLKNFVGIKIFR